MHEDFYRKYNGIFTHAQTVCTRPFLGGGGGGPGDEAILNVAREASLEKYR